MTLSASIVLKQRRKIINDEGCVLTWERNYIPFCAAICAASLRFLELYPRFEGPVLIPNDKEGSKVEMTYLERHPFLAP